MLPGKGLEVLTEALDVAVGAQADGRAEEGFVDVVASFPADAQAEEPCSHEIECSTTQRNSARAVHRREGP